MFGIQTDYGQPHHRLCLFGFWKLREGWRNVDRLDALAKVSSMATFEIDLQTSILGDWRGVRQMRVSNFGKAANWKILMDRPKTSHLFDNNT
jgi:hypothetical protein